MKRQIDRAPRGPEERRPKDSLIEWAWAILAAVVLLGCIVTGKQFPSHEVSQPRCFPVTMFPSHEVSQSRCFPVTIIGIIIIVLHS